MLIFDEYSHAEKMLNRGFTKGFSYAELSILARYFKDKGKNANQIRSDLLDFCTKHLPCFNEVLYFRKIDSAVASCKKYKIRKNNPVSITRSEMEQIRTIDNTKYQKILFTALVISRYFKDNNNFKKDNREKSQDYYLNISYHDVIKLAKVTLRKEDKIKMLYTLTQAGFFTPTLHNSIKLNYANDESEKLIVVEDINNIHKYYTFQCACCKKEFSKLNRNSLCENCYAEKRKDTIRDSVRKSRHSKKEGM